MKLRLDLFFDSGTGRLLHRKHAQVEIDEIANNNAKADDRLIKEYERVLSRNARGKYSRSILQRIFQVVLAAAHPLSFTQIAEAVAIAEPSQCNYFHEEIDVEVDIGVCGADHTEPACGKLPEGGPVRAYVCGRLSALDS